MNKPLRAFIGMLDKAAKPLAEDDARFAHIERKHQRYLQMMHETFAARHAAVMELTEQINAAWRALPEEEKERQRAYWNSKKKDDGQWDADVDREERGLTPIQYYWENK